MKIMLFLALAALSLASIDAGKKSQTKDNNTFSGLHTILLNETQLPTFLRFIFDIAVYKIQLPSVLALCQFCCQ